jgi:hypothetical protein
MEITARKSFPFCDEFDETYVLQSSCASRLKARRFRLSETNTTAALTLATQLNPSAIFGET